MKKNYLLLILISFIISSCDKHDVAESGEKGGGNCAVPVSGNSKSAAGVYSIYVMTGHPAAGCDGCVVYAGQPIHVDCVGYGNACSRQASVSLSLQQNDKFQAVTLNEYDLTSDDLFFMPDRSLLVELINGGKEELWLNIPEQLSARDAGTGMFTFNDLFFTSYQVYKNQ